MKKILALLIITLFAAPTFAACKIEEPCTANIIDDTHQTLQERIDPNPLDQQLKTDMQQQRSLLKQNNSFINDNINYNANCQFGICLPERNTEIIETED